MFAINVALDKSEKFLDKQRDIKNNDGIKRTVDAFRVVGMAGKVLMLFSSHLLTVFGQKKNAEQFINISQ